MKCATCPDCGQRRIVVTRRVKTSPHGYLSAGDLKLVFRRHGLSGTTCREARPVPTATQVQEIS